MSVYMADSIYFEAKYDNLSEIYITIVFRHRTTTVKASPFKVYIYIYIYILLLIFYFLFKNDSSLFWNAKLLFKFLYSSFSNISFQLII
jgi:hypothetical protein